MSRTAQRGRPLRARHRSRLPLPFGQTTGDAPRPLAETVDAFERALIADALRCHGSPAPPRPWPWLKTTLYDKIRKYGLRAIDPPWPGSGQDESAVAHGI